MSDSERIAELEGQVARHARARALSAAVDARLEEALKKLQPLERVMPALLEILTQHLGARAAAVRTLDEALTERTFVRGDVDIDHVLLESTESRVDRGHEFVLLHSLDVAGEPFGTAFLFFPVPPGDEAPELLELFCEELDNHLAAIAGSRRKFEVIRSISDALKEPVLDRGIAHAVEILQRHVKFDDLVLMFRHEDSLEASAVRYRIYKRGALLHASLEVSDPEVDVFLRENANAFFDGDDAELRDRFGITRYREEVLITGVRTARVVGRILVTSRQGEFHTYDRELLDRFADYLRQRIVDFNREWKQLSVIFPATVCERLLREEDYLTRWLTPRDREVAILYGDISGFTHISEQVLKSPEAIGRLIDTWADRAVAAIWERGGVFDKMIGDCVIGIFGPPFYEDDPTVLCRKALETAKEIRTITRELIEDPQLSGELGPLERPLDVAIGLNYCPVSVGFFGPNENYTAFSSGMNNTARLQGIANGGQILCMQRFVEVLGHSERFGPSDEARVKNVAVPLVYRPLTD